MQGYERTRVSPGEACKQKEEGFQGAGQVMDVAQAMARVSQSCRNQLTLRGWRRQAIAMVTSRRQRPYSSSLATARAIALATGYC